MITSNDIGWSVTLALVVMTGFILVNGLLATVAKERDMVRNGGEPLGTSSYVFLGLHYLVQFFITGALGLGLTKVFDFTTVGGALDEWSVLWFASLVVGLAMILTLIIETLVKTLVIYLVVKARTKKTAQQVRDSTNDTVDIDIGE